MRSRKRIKAIASVVALAVTMLLLSRVDTLAQRSEHITATAMGTSSQLGRTVNIDLLINSYSTDAEKNILVAAFVSDGNNGLVNALDKMPARGRLSIPGTLGYDVNYIRQFRNPDGSRVVRFVTDRPISFQESWAMTRSADYNVTMGEITIRRNQSASTGTLLPATKVKLSDDKEIEVETFGNPWKLTNIRVSR